VPVHELSCICMLEASILPQKYFLENVVFDV